MLMMKLVLYYVKYIFPRNESVTVIVFLYQTYPKDVISLRPSARNHRLLTSHSLISYSSRRGSKYNLGMVAEVTLMQQNEDNQLDLFAFVDNVFDSIMNSDLSWVISEMISKLIEYIF